MKRVGSGCSRPPVNLADSSAPAKPCRRWFEVPGLFVQPRWEEVDVSSVRVDGTRELPAAPGSHWQTHQKTRLQNIARWVDSRRAARIVPLVAHVAGAGDLPACKAEPSSDAAAGRTFVRALGPVGLARRRCRRQDQLTTDCIAPLERAFAAQGKNWKNTSSSDWASCSDLASTTCCWIRHDEHSTSRANTRRTIRRHRSVATFRAGATALIANRCASRWW